MAAVILSPANCEIWTVIRFRMNWPESSEIMKRRFCKNVCLTFFISSGVTRDGRPLRSSLCTVVRPSVNCPYHRLIILSLIISGPARGTFGGGSLQEIALSVQKSDNCRQYHYSHFHLALCNNYWRQKTETALHFTAYFLSIAKHSHSLPTSHTTSGRDWNFHSG